MQQTQRVEYQRDGSALVCVAEKTHDVPVSLRRRAPDRRRRQVREHRRDGDRPPRQPWLRSEPLGAKRRGHDEPRGCAHHFEQQRPLGQSPRPAAQASPFPWVGELVQNRNQGEPRTPQRLQNRPDEHRKPSVGVREHRVVENHGAGPALLELGRERSRE